jgi:hypothetical protein
MEYIVRDVTHSHRTIDVGTGSLSFDKKTQAVHLFSDEGRGRCVAQLDRAMVTQMATAGIWIVGYKPDGIDKHRRQRFVLTEWFCAYKEH